MGCIHKQEINTSASWHEAGSARDQSWFLHFTDAKIAALDQAVVVVMALGLQFPDFGKADFPLSGWDDWLRSFADELEKGQTQNSDNSMTIVGIIVGIIIVGIISGVIFKLKKN